MLRLICYDISDDRTRSLMAARLLDFGVRVQESVFECLLDEEQFQRMMAALQKIPLAPLDRVRVYQVCANCVRDIEIYGPDDSERLPDFYLVG